MRLAASRFIIQPDKPDFSLILAAGQYRKLWQQYGQQLLDGFYKVSGLSIERTQITAKVIDGAQSSAGNGLPHHPMRLAGGNYRSDEFKLMTIVHELTHRLLNSNKLGPYWLGFEESPYEQEINHRHVYLISYDCVRRALGDTWAVNYRKYEKRYRWTTETSPHVAAWQWVIRMNNLERARMRTKLCHDRIPLLEGARVKNY